MSVPAKPGRPASVADDAKGSRRSTRSDTGEPPGGTRVTRSVREAATCLGQPAARVQMPDAGSTTHCELTTGRRPTRPE